MKINLETIQKLNPCQDRLDNYKNHYNTSDFTLEEFLKLNKIAYSDKVWVITKLFTKKQNTLWSIKCAESVLHLFENKYPEDKRPRNAIEAAKLWTLKQNSSAESTAWSAAWSAAEAATAAAAWYAARYAWSAAEAATAAAESTAKSSTEKQQEELNLKFMLEVYNETKGE
jgi:hypothetical protein